MQYPDTFYDSEELKLMTDALDAAWLSRRSLRMVAPPSCRWSCARQPSCFTSCSHSGPEGGARFRTGAEGTMKGFLRDTGES
jgi:hypothetical protein